MCNIIQQISSKSIWQNYAVENQRHADYEESQLKNPNPSHA